MELCLLDLHSIVFLSFSADVRPAQLAFHNELLLLISWASSNDGPNITSQYPPFDGPSPDAHAERSKTSSNVSPAKIQPHAHHPIKTGYIQALSGIGRTCAPEGCVTPKNKNPDADIVIVIWHLVKTRKQTMVQQGKLAQNIMLDS